jgi:hypothetical protein
MLSKLLPKIAYISVLFLLISSLHSQNKTLDLVNDNALLLTSLNNGCDCCNTLNINTPFFEGKIILKDSTILIGKISINQLYQNNLIAILNVDNDYRAIDNKTIKEVVLLSPEHKETKFFNLNIDERLYRLVYQKHTIVSVYDASNKLQDNSLIGRLLVKENNMLTDTWNFWSSGPKNDLINYMNDRDNTNFKRRNFKSLDQIFAAL